MLKSSFENTDEAMKHRRHKRKTILKKQAETAIAMKAEVETPIQTSTLLSDNAPDG